ncbi:MAG: Fe-S cluster assembly protein SufD [Chloroflexi bacterium]|nr:Fe-S cluster assembly protein SufD [Chloroflexota bacterium]
MRRIREEAITRFKETGFPTPRDEDWKYTNVAPIARARFVPSWECSNGRRPLAGVTASTAKSHGWIELAFVGGDFAPALSSVPELPPGARVMSLASALVQEADLVQPHLARYADLRENGFVALNTAFIRDGAFIYVPKGVTLDATVHILFSASTGGEATVSYPRNLIILAEGSRASVMESYEGPGQGPYFTNAVTEVVLGPGARLDYYRLQGEGREAYHVSATRVEQGQDSRFTSFYMDLGGRLGRNDLKVSLGAEGGSCSLNGLYLIGDQQHIDNHTTVDHQSSFTPSRQLYKGILDGHSRAVFNGKIIARKGTHQVDAHQTNKNLLISEDSQVSTKPQLEIFADDLKCTHGATVGQLDEEALFYLNSRGIGQEAARLFLTYGFAQGVLSQIESDEIRRLFEGLTQERLQVKTKVLTT